MLMPDVTELLDDPDLGGGEAFTVVRDTRTRSLEASAQGAISRVRIDATGNIQPAQTEDLQLLPDEDRSEETIVIRSVLSFQLGSDGHASYTLPDIVLYDNRAWKVIRIDHWQSWGFNTVYAKCLRGESPSKYAPITTP